jgi:hypothetical protein
MLIEKLPRVCNSGLVHYSFKVLLLVRKNFSTGPFAVVLLLANPELLWTLEQSAAVILLYSGSGLDE